MQGLQEEVPYKGWNKQNLKNTNGDERNMIEKPVWYDYVVWDMSDPSFPVPKGFKPDTPKDVIKAYKKDLKEYQQAQEENPDAEII